MDIWALFPQQHASMIVERIHPSDACSFALGMRGVLVFIDAELGGSYCQKAMIFLYRSLFYIYILEVQGAVHITKRFPYE